MCLSQDSLLQFLLHRACSSSRREVLLHSWKIHKSLIHNEYPKLNFSLPVQRQMSNFYKSKFRRGGGGRGRGRGKGKGKGEQGKGKGGRGILEPIYCLFFGQLQTTFQSYLVIQQQLLPGNLPIFKSLYTRIFLSQNPKNVPPHSSNYINATPSQSIQL